MNTNFENAEILVLDRHKIRKLKGPDFNVTYITRQIQNSDVDIFDKGWLMGMIAYLDGVGCDVLISPPHDTQVDFNAGYYAGYHDKNNEGFKDV